MESFHTLRNNLNMDLVSPIFKKKKVNIDKLKKYGFEEKSSIFTINKEILNGDFTIVVSIQNNNVSIKVIDALTNDEYNLVFLDKVTGEFVGNMREEIKTILEEISSSCFDDVMFETEQANRICKYIYKTYHIEPDFPWPKSNDFAVFRNKDNDLWFALFGSFVDKKDSKKHIIANVKANPLLINELHKVEGVIPAYHMNKKSWITIYLDDTLNDEYIESLIDYSYNSNVGIKKKRYYKK